MELDVCARGGLRTQVLCGRQGPEALLSCPRRRGGGGVQRHLAAMDAADAVHGQVQAGARAGCSQGPRDEGRGLVARLDAIHQIFPFPRGSSLRNVVPGHG